MNRVSHVPFMDRVRLISYGLLAGLLIGVVVGWMFNRVVGTLLWVFFIALLLTPAVLAFLFWQRVTRRNERPPARDVRDADWVEIEANSRPRR